MNMGLSKLSLLDPDREKLVEDRGAKTVAYFCRRRPALIDKQLIDELKQISVLRGECNARVCLHDSPGAPHHDMVALERGNRYYRPHKHNGKGDTFHMIEGCLGVFTFDDAGQVIDAVSIGRGEIYRTDIDSYHAILPLTEFVIHHESKPGPFTGAGDSIFPDWAPDGSDPDETERYLARLMAYLPDVRDP